MRLKRAGLRLAALAAAVAGGWGCAEPPSPLAGSNVVLVVVDALAAAHLGSYGYDRPTSPFIDSLARRGVLFENAVATASHTVPSTLSLLTSAYPSRHQNQYFPETRSFRRPESGVRPKIPDGLASMAELFQAAGHRTVAVTANPWIRERYGFHRGFDDFVFLPASEAHPRAERLNEAAEEVFQSKSQRPFFLYLHYMDVHNPYTPPEPYRSQFTRGLSGRVLRRNGLAPDATPEDVAVTRARYDGEIRAFDANLKRLYEQLRSAQLLDSTLVVFTADHGEEFHQHGGLGHGWTLFEENVHVPLFFVHPALRDHARRIDEPVSSVDLLPTLLELVGLPAAGGLDGRSLAPVVLGRNQAPEQGRLLFAELGDVKAVRRGDHKLISSKRAGRSPATAQRAFDLSSDPAEASPLEAAVWQEAMRSELERLHAATGQSAAASESQSGDSTESGEPWFEEQLRALGYAE